MFKKIRVRIAPSPTGPFHIGTARTALFNYLFARCNKGEFILRFEDTDRARSTKEFEKKIITDLKWLGLEWDGEIEYQMERLDIYKKYAEGLIKKDYAFEKDGALWFDAEKTLKSLKIDFETTKKTFEHGKHGKGDGKAFALKNIGSDQIHGEISGLISDTVLIKKDGIPTFHFANVIDDAKMGITHVIRGDDHLPNTPLHIILQKALGFSTPQYAHIPLILNADRSKMSKRTGEVDISKYREDGYLPEAMVNFLALLGWTPEKEKDIFSLEEIVVQFELEKIHKSAAVFDREKLDSLNGLWIRALKPEELDKRLRDGFYPSGDAGTLALTKALQTRMVKLSEAKEMSEFFFEEPSATKEVLIFKKSDEAQTKKGLEAALKALESAGSDGWQSLDKLNSILAGVVKSKGLQNGDVFWPIRACLTGKMQSPSPTEILLVIGKEKSRARIEKAIEILN